MNTMKRNMQKALEITGIVLPRDVQEWHHRCVEYISTFYTAYQPLTNQYAPGYGILWFDIAAPQALSPGREKADKALMCTPHSDDLEYNFPVATVAHVQNGDTVSELLWSLGSIGRPHRGFADITPPIGEEQEMKEVVLGSVRSGNAPASLENAPYPSPIGVFLSSDGRIISREVVARNPEKNNQQLAAIGPVRLAEALAGASQLRIRQLGIVVTPDGRIGCLEGHIAATNPKLDTVALSILRQVNPNYLYAPHHDISIEVHPDHHDVGEAMRVACVWAGDEFNPNMIPFAERDNHTTPHTKRLMAGWVGMQPGNRVLPANRFFSFESEKNPDLLPHLAGALQPFLSQAGAIYAEAHKGRLAWYGIPRHVHEDRVVYSEPYEDSTGPGEEWVMYQRSHSL